MLANGFDRAHLPTEKCDQLCEHLLKESESTFGHARQCKKHEEPLLTKYFYISQKESIDTTKQFKTDVLPEHLSDAKAVKVALESQSSLSINNGATTVKAENPGMKQADLG